MKQFDESVKTAYVTGSEEVYYINFPLANLDDDPENAIQANCLTLTSDVLGEIFEPLVTDIQRLVEEQVNLARLKQSESGDSNSEIKAIFLVGGFGSSRHLKECIECSSFCSGIQVIQPEDAWSAIVRGAILSELPQEAAVVSSIAQRNYGIKARSDYIAHEDRGQPKQWDAYLGKHRVTKMFWYIQKGESLERSRKIQFPFYRKFGSVVPAPEDLVISETLYECDSISAPKYPSNTLRANCTVTSDLRNAPKSAFRVKTPRKGNTYCEVHYNILVTINSASMEFSIEIDGKTYGKGKAEYH